MSDPSAFVVNGQIDPYGRIDGNLSRAVESIRQSPPAIQGAPLSVERLLGIVDQSNARSSIDRRVLFIAETTLWMAEAVDLVWIPPEQELENEEPDEASRLFWVFHRVPEALSSLLNSAENIIVEDIVRRTSTTVR